MDSSEGSVNSDGNELAEAVVQHEWQQFQRTDNEGGRAACQGNWRCSTRCG